MLYSSTTAGKGETLKFIRKQAFTLRHEALWNISCIRNISQPVHRQWDVFGEKYSPFLTDFFESSMIAKEKAKKHN